MGKGVYTWYENPLDGGRIYGITDILHPAYLIERCSGIRFCRICGTIIPDKPKMRPIRCETCKSFRGRIHRPMELVQKKVEEGVQDVLRRRKDIKKKLFVAYFQARREGKEGLE